MQNDEYEEILFQEKVTVVFFFGNLMNGTDEGEVLMLVVGLLGSDRV